MATRQDSEKRVDDCCDHGQIFLAEKGSAMIGAASRLLTHWLDHLHWLCITGQSPLPFTLEDGKQVLKMADAKFGLEGNGRLISSGTGVQ